MTTSRYAAVCALMCVLALSACANTVRGVGRDVNQTVDAVEESID